jgi:gliding motility-associated-like protein
VRIFNRNGALIYQSKGYAKSWDGTVKGAKVAAGTYYYIIKANASSGAQRSSYVAVVK